ncbi:MAG: SMI1/KNR4 family protein, partial [Verrucomicrobiota bacterium]
VRNDWWNKKWIPFTYNGCGDHHCLDLDPSDEGARGQVIRMWHDMAERPVEGGSLGEWFADYTSRVVSGDYCYCEAYEGILPKSECPEPPKESYFTRIKTSLRRMASGVQGGS